MYIARWHELQASFSPVATLDTMVNVGTLAPRLDSAATLRTLLERYERLDEELSAFESSMAAAAASWAEMVGHAVDAAPGG